MSNRRRPPALEQPSRLDQAEPQSSEPQSRALRSDVAPTRRRTRTGRRLPAVAFGLDEFLRCAALLPIDAGPEATARGICDLVRALRSDVAVGVVLSPESPGSDPIYVTVAPLLPTAEPIETQAIVPSMGGRATDPQRLFPGLDDEWIMYLPAPFEGTSLHVAGALERDGTLDRTLTEIVERAAILLASGLRAAQQVRQSRGEGQKLRELQARIIQSEKLASVGQIAAQVVHELNNPLTAIVSYADFLTKKLDRAQHDPGDVERLRRIGESAERILRFSRDLTAYARPVDELAAPVALPEVITRAVLFCEHVVEELHISVKLRIDPQTPSIVGRRGQLTQVFVNLITNACHAIQDRERSEEGVIEIVAAPTDTGVRVSIGDNGNGISPQNLVRIFDPFFTTKPEGRGTGLGLSIVRSIVEEHDGRIHARSVVGAGTQFIVDFRARG